MAAAIIKAALLSIVLSFLLTLGWYVLGPMLQLLWDSQTNTPQTTGFALAVSGSRFIGTVLLIEPFAFVLAFLLMRPIRTTN